MALFNKNITPPTTTTTNQPSVMSKTAEINSPDRLNRIVEGTSIEGDIRSDSNIRIDGKLKGTIHTKGRLVIGSSGIIEGEIICENADIEGVFIGKINVNQLLSLKSTAKLTGDIITSKLAIEPGAMFSGACSMGGMIKDLKSSEPIKQNANQPAEKTA
jgi:cytoskeletal protein CcmA (bactofilin family)